MPLFQYRVLQADGTIAEGQFEAANRQEAYRQIEHNGWTALGLAETKTGASKSGLAAAVSSFKWPGSGKVPYRSLEDFTRNLANLLAAGVPLARTLRLLSHEASHPVAREKWLAIHDMVIEGSSLANAMANLPETFPHIYVAMVQAGETGGFLDLVLGQIADFQSREKELKSKVMTALIYPAVLAGLAVCVVSFLLVFFIPKFQTMFSDFGAALPALTQFIVAASNVARHYGFFVVAIVGSIVYMVRRWFKTEAGRRVWEAWVLRLPVMGAVSARFALTRFCRMLGTLIGSGVPMITALRVARESLGNQILVDTVSKSIDRVQQGERLSASLADCKDLFPGSVIEMISMAEETARLDKELVRLAATMETDLDRQLKTAVALAEPAMLVVMAAVIGLIVVGMVLPIFTIQDYIK
ncbi:MAG TPA: type II secretion system F family protein [Candidatus Sumerlaeota bacterium]|nr:type II secretion system F family protein [Candidatus Sumerlaeota bacterium]